MKALFTCLALLISAAAFSQNQDTLKCRALFSDPRSTYSNKPVSVTNFYVVLKDGRPVKFLMMDKKRETTMEIWDYRLVGESRWSTKKVE
jgi:hypothetical protein